MFNKSLVVVFFAVVFFLSFSSVSFADNLYNRYGGIQNQFGSQKSGSTVRNLIDTLDNVGLLKIVKIVVGPAFNHVVEALDTGFHHLNKEQHVDDINRIVGHFKKSWFKAVSHMMEEAAPGEIVDNEKFVEFMSLYQSLLDMAIRNDSYLEKSDVLKLLGQVNVLFSALDALYQAFFNTLENLEFTHLMTWNIFALTNGLVAGVPDKIIDFESMKEVLQTPNEILKGLDQSIQQLYQLVDESPIGNFLPSAIKFAENTLKGWVENQQIQQNHRYNRGEL